MIRHALILLAALPNVALAASPPSRDEPVVVELFTSQGCSSCPPADGFLRELARRPDVLALSFHVTYWNRLGWTDPYSLQAATDRQRTYAHALGDGEVYTPEMVVQGARGVVGSDRGEAARAIAEAPAASVPIQLSRDGGDLLITIGRGAMRGQVLLVGFDAEHQTHIGRGENGGLDLREANLVRSIVVAGRWSGTPLVLRQAVPNSGQVAVLLQAENGRILGDAHLTLAPHA